jgi:predicted TIM-barrel fold metal-dependent hydrolase
MGWYVAEDPHAPAALEGWLARPSMLAIRFMFHSLDWSQWRPGGPIHPFLSAAERLGIPVSLVAWEGLAGLGPTFARYPKLRLLVDHANLVGTRPYQIRARVGELEDLARYPNVAVKVAAMPAFSAESYPYGDLHEPLKRIYQAFGPRRMIWGSDHTMVSGRGKATYRESLDFIREAGGRIMSADELEWVMDRSIANWLNWPRRQLAGK